MSSSDTNEFLFCILHTVPWLFSFYSVGSVRDIQWTGVDCRTSSGRGILSGMKVYYIDQVLLCVVQSRRCKHNKCHILLINFYIIVILHKKMSITFFLYMGLFKSINMYMYKLSPYEWKFFKWNDKSAQINKTIKPPNYWLYNLFSVRGFWLAFLCGWLNNNLQWCVCIFPIGRNRWWVLWFICSKIHFLMLKLLNYSFAEIFLCSMKLKGGLFCYITVVGKHIRNSVEKKKRSKHNIYMSYGESCDCTWIRSE